MRARWYRLGEDTKAEILQEAFRTLHLHFTVNYAQISSLLTRFLQVVIHPMESSGQPQFYGVTVDKKAKQSDLIKAAMQMVGHAGDARGATMSPGHRRIWHKPSSDLEPTSGDMHIFCLPRAPPSPPQASKDHPQVPPLRM